MLEGLRYRAVVAVDFEFEFGGTGFSDFFEQIFGARGARRAGGFGRQPQFADEEFAGRGHDIEGDIMVTLEEAARGSIRSVSVRHGSRTDTHQVKIPAGVTEGQRLRIAGRGEHGSGGGAAGDLYLRVRVRRIPLRKNLRNDQSHPRRRASAIQTIARRNR